MKLEEKLVTLRKEKGLSQLKLAEMMNVSRQAISRWESGTAVPSTDNLRLLSELYGISIDYLINEERERPIQSEEEENRENKKVRKWVVCLICILIMAVAAVIIGLIATRKEPEKVDFNDVESEDWNDVSTDNIPIEW